MRSQVCASQTSFPLAVVERAAWILDQRAGITGLLRTLENAVVPRDRANRTVAVVACTHRVAIGVRERGRM
jgi:hypothetical protein